MLVYVHGYGYGYRDQGIGIGIDMGIGIGMGKGTTVVQISGYGVLVYIERVDPGPGAHCALYMVLHGAILKHTHTHIIDVKGLLTLKYFKVEL